MDGSPLYQLINQIEYGTKLHIGVLFFRSYGNASCALPNSHGIHQSPTCDVFKIRSHRSFMRCYRCRFLAIQKALREKQPFGGLCINGVYEYTHPVILNDDVAAIVFIGNILDGERSEKKLRENAADAPLALDTLEADFSPERCRQVAETIDRYVTFLLEKYPNEHAKEKPLITNIKRYIEDAPALSATAAELSSAFHYNPRYLGRLFKKETGLSLGDYILSRRLTHAKQLLRETDHSVMDVSVEVGFNSVTYFNKCFKTAFGLTPTDYRKQAKASA